MDFASIEERIVYEHLSSGLLMQEYAEKVGPQEGRDNLLIANGTLSDNRHIKAMERTKNNSAYRPIKSTRKLASLIIFVKKILRKYLLKWYVEPFSVQQTQFNEAATGAVSVQNEYIQKMATILTELSLRYDGLIKDSSQRIEDLNQTQLSYNERFMEVQRKIEFLESCSQRIEDLNQTQLSYNERFMEVQRKIEFLESCGVFSDKHPTFDKRSFSQTGEDMILSIVFQLLHIPLTQVQYLDLGANHAKEISNTYYFYSLGSRGVLLEANPALIPELKLFRNGDVVINKCISNQSGEKVPFYIISGDGLSTASEESAKEFIEANTMLTLDRVVEVEAITVMEIIDQYFDGAPTLLNIDIEGKEEEVLRSIDFNKCRPAVIVCEMIPYVPNTLVIGRKNQEILGIMEINDYSEFAFTGINSIFIDNQRLRGSLQ